MINQSLKRFTPEAWRSLTLTVINNVVHLGNFIFGQDILYDEIAFKIYLKFFFTCHGCSSFIYTDLLVFNLDQQRGAAYRWRVASASVSAAPSTHRIC